MLIGFEVVAVHVADLRPDLPQNRPRDQPVGLEVANTDRDVVLAQFRKVVERLTVHVNDEAVARGGDGPAFGVLQHSG